MDWRRRSDDVVIRSVDAVLPVIRDAIAKSAALEGLALSQALWAKMCAGLREDGSVIEANDPIWEALNKAAGSPTTWLEQSQIYGDLSDDTRFKKSFYHWAKFLSENGVVGALRAYLNTSLEAS